MAKHDKKDFFLRQDFEIRTYKACKCHEILDEVARKQDHQSDDTMDGDLRSTMITLTNDLGVVSGKKSREQTEK